MREALVFEAERSGYAIDQIADRAMTVGELKRLLEDYDDDTLFVLSHDRGYTYGSISSWDCELRDDWDEEEEAEEEEEEEEGEE